MRKHLVRTTAILLAVGGLAMSAHAQEAQETPEAQELQGSEQVTAVSYCDDPWTAVDRNNNGVVSEEEAARATDLRFDEIDADGNGEIGKTEYVDCMTRTNDQAAAEVERDEESFAQADANKDDQIDRDEFREQASKAFEESRTASADDPDAWVVFQRYVWLTPEEFDDSKMLSEMTADEAAGRSAMTFAALDQNSDGILDTEEWSEKSPPSHMDEEWASARFDEFDENASGAIDKEEYRTARSDMLDEMPTASTTDDGSSTSDNASSADDRRVMSEEYQARSILKSVLNFQDRWSPRCSAAHDQAIPDLSI